MDKTITNGKMEIACNKDITKCYKSVHNSYVSTLSKPSLEQREWMTLISFLNKNKTKKCKILQLSYPFTILKSERPDFVLVMNKKSISIEIVRVAPKNLEALISLSYKHNKTGWESDERLYNDTVKMKKKKLRKLFWKPGEELCGNAILGYSKEKKWAKLCYEAIKSKSNKSYIMDILLLDDHHIQSCHEENVKIGIEYLKQQLCETPLLVSNIGSIVSENQSGLILLYDRYKWLFEYKQYINYD